MRGRSIGRLRRSETANCARRRKACGAPCSRHRRRRQQKRACGLASSFAFNVRFLRLAGHHRSMLPSAAMRLSIILCGRSPGINIFPPWASFRALTVSQPDLVLRYQAYDQVQSSLPATDVTRRKLAPPSDSLPSDHSADGTGRA